MAEFMPRCASRSRTYCGNMTCFSIVTPIEKTLSPNGQRKLRRRDKFREWPNRGGHFMRVFVDSADQKQIEDWLAQGVVDGVTTNPSIMFKDWATDLEECARRRAALLGERPLSVEVTSNDRETMVEQARTFATWARNIVVKLPVVNEYRESCLGLMDRLSQEGIGLH